MSTIFPITLEILACFILSASLLYRYADFINQNVVTIVAVFVSWFFSFMVIFMLPADVSSTAYRQCLANSNGTILPNNLTTFNSDNITSLSWSNSTIHNNITSFGNQSSNTSFAAEGQQNSGHLTAINQGSLSHQSGPSSNVTTFDLTSKTFLKDGSTSISSNNVTEYNSTTPCLLPWNYVSPKVLPKLWRFIYWTCQLLTWIVLPLMQSYTMAGDFTPWDKFKSALRANIIYYSSYGAIFSILLIYVIFKNGIDFSNLKVIAISSSNTWGLFLLVILLGYGLIELPRYLINRSRCASSLNHLYYQVARLNSEKCDAEEKLDDSLEEIHQAFTAIGNAENHPIRECLNLIVDKCPPDWKRRSIAFRRQNAAANSTVRVNLGAGYNMETMIRLHRKVIRSVHFYRQTTCRWTQLIREVVEWEDVALNLSQSTSSHYKVFQSSIPKQRTQSIYDRIKYAIFTPTLEWYWKCLIRAWILRVLGIAMATLSVAVVWSEMTFSIHQPILSIFANTINASQYYQNYFIMEVFSILSIGYLAMCAFYTVFKMRIFNIYYLAINHQTDEYSLLFSGMLLCRLASPLCLNYLCLIQRDSHIVKQQGNVETAFTSIMGHLDLIPIVSNGLNIFLPICISAICLALYFNLGTHLLHSLGFEQFIQGDDITQDWIQNGRELVKREKSKLLRNFEAGSNYHNINSRSTGDPRMSSLTDGKHPDYSSTMARDNSSRDSLTSTSSGLSRSSLIPGSARDDAPMKFYTSPTDTIPDSVYHDRHDLASPTPHFSNSVTADDRSINNDQIVRPSKGFFDDV